ncbi:SLC13 family permease [Granulosicoccus sp. 3-233]|uniref:SLC13 family permease n=1 Tax=Granulosicoccus sp. 3-233 TaxID=3417969 RepID=UPI003D34623E
MVQELTLSIEMLVVMGLLSVTIALFAFELLRVDVAAICVMVLLGLTTLLPGLEPLVSREELFSGFSSNAVISVIAVMIIGAGLDKTGLMGKVASLILQKGGKTEKRIIPLVSGTVALISSFMQNIGAAALFLPVVSRISDRTAIPMSRLLMPMGFCAILGGTVTMIGSSPLILLNDLLISANRTLPAEQQMDTFGLFSVTPLGLALVATGVMYFVLAGRFVLPATSKTDDKRISRAADYFENVYGIKGELVEIRVTPESPQAGMTIHQLEDANPDTPVILALYSGDVVKVPPDREEIIWVNTHLGLMGDRQQIERYCRDNHWEVLGEPDRFADVLNAQHSGIAEIVIPPGSSLIGQRIGDIKPRRNFGTNILQIFRSEDVIRHDFRDQVLQPGDTLVVHASWKDLKSLSRSSDFVLATDVKYEDLRTNKVREAAAFFLLGLVLFLVTDSLAISLLTGAMGMVLSGVLTMDEAYTAVSWQTVFLLASLIPLGIAVDQSGTAAWIAQEILRLVGDVPDWVLQVVIALLATFFTLVMSNIGATVLLVPLAVNIAVAVDADPALFALTVAISTSNSFLIPTHQVNALLMGPGGYQVADFMRAGGIMTILFLLVSLLMLNLLM